ncbi:MAG: ParB N-terminal domain-containing protein [Pseudolabrys sp.]
MTPVTSTETNSDTGDVKFVEMADRNVPAQISPDTPAFHPLADLFPLMECEEFGRLVESIRASGLRECIILHHGQILDGRNRFRACLEAGVEPQFDRLPNGDDPLRFVIDKNLRRRHLTERFII